MNEENQIKNEEVKDNLIEKANKNVKSRIATYAATADVYNETDLRNAINNRASYIRIWNSSRT